MAGSCFFQHGLKEPMMSFDLICTQCQQMHTDDPPTLCDCGNPLEVQYHWKRSLSRDAIDESDLSMWRYRNFLPPVEPEHITSLGEGWTPLTTPETYNGVRYCLKNETVNPTGSFKDRGMSMAISMLRQSGVKTICVPSAGNAGVAAAAYGHAGNIDAHIYLSKVIPFTFVRDTKKYGARIYFNGNTIADAATKMKQEMKETWFDLSTLKEPFRVEGKKTLGYELAEQLGWTLPDVIIYPTGGGTGLIGMWKAFQEMRFLGWIAGPLPRMVAVQSDGCAPVVSAFKENAEKTEFWENSFTKALGLNVPGPIGGPWMLRVLYESKGTALSVQEKEIGPRTLDISRISGIEASEEGGAVWSAFIELVSQGWIKKGEVTVLFMTGKQR